MKILYLCLSALSLSASSLMAQAAQPTESAVTLRSTASVEAEKRAGVPARYVRSNDGTLIAVYEQGPPDAKTILLIHGFSHNSAVWYNQLSSRILSRFHIVAMDLRGHGYSGKPDSDQAYALQSGAYADDVKAVIDGLALNRPALVGWSMGGFVVAEYLRKYGDSEISGVDLVDSVACPDRACADTVLKELPQFNSFTALADENADVEMTGIREFVNAESSGSESDSSRLTPEQALILQGIMITTPRRVRAAILAGMGTDGIGVYRDVLSSLKVPMLVQHGTNDPFFSADLVAGERALVKNFSADLYPRTAHIPFILSAGKFNRDLATWVDSLLQ